MNLAIWGLGVLIADFQWPALDCVRCVDESVESLKIQSCLNVVQRHQGHFWQSVQSSLRSIIWQGL